MVTLCSPARSAGPTSRAPYDFALVIVSSPSCLPSAVTRTVGQPLHWSPIAPRTTRPPPVRVVVAVLLLLHSEACVPPGGVGDEQAGDDDHCGHQGQRRDQPPG